MLHAQKQGRLFSSQSKGGSIGGQINTQKSLANANKLIGTQKGKWLVKGISPIKKNHKTSLELICTGCKRQFVYTWNILIILLEQLAQDVKQDKDIVCSIQ